MDEACATCDTALVRTSRRPPHDIDVSRTIDALQRRVDDEVMRVIRSDVPLGDMIALAESDLAYTIVSFLGCRECGRTRFWGLCIRGAPVYKVVSADAPAKHRWERIPDRAQWA